MDYLIWVFNNKKGIFVIDMIFVVVVLLFVAIVIVFGFMNIKMINDDIQADPDLSVEAKVPTQTLHNFYPEVFDKGFLFILVALWIFFLASTFFMDSHPIFFILFLILLIFLFITTVIINNVWYDVITDTDLAVYQTSFPILCWYFDNILIVWIVIGFSTLVTLFAKSNSNSGGF